MGQKGRVFTGARARLLLAGRKVGYAVNCNGSEEIQYEPLDVLDNIETEEWVPVGYRVSFSASMVRIVGETVKSLGLFPKTGNDPQTHLSNILDLKDLSAVLEDSKTGSRICTVEQMKMSTHSLSVNARGMAAKDVNFVCTRMRDESDV